MSQKAINITIIVILVLSLGIGIASYIKSVNPKFLPNPDGTPPKGGLGGAFADILSNIPTWLGGLLGNQCDPKKIGYTKDGKYNPTKCSGYSVLDCDPNRIGYDKDGIANALCGKDYSGCDATKCDPFRSGYNQCGFPDTNCSFGG